MKERDREGRETWGRDGGMTRGKGAGGETREENEREEREGMSEKAMRERVGVCKRWE